jgi:hypothetical protein
MLTRKPVTLPLPAGYVAAPAPTGLKLVGPDGRLVLEIDTIGSAPCLRLPDTDLALDLPGRLKIAARSIDLQASLGNVTIRANDDVVVEGERIRLN